MLNLAGLLKLLVFQPIDKRDWKQVKKEDVKVGYSKFMNNRINDSQTEGL
jgi:hypothetical protein